MVIKLVDIDGNFLCLFAILESIEVFMASITVLFPENPEVVNTLRNATLRTKYVLPNLNAVSGRGVLFSFPLVPVSDPIHILRYRAVYLVFILL